jgi:cephalosporin hydroxylase
MDQLPPPIKVHFDDSVRAYWLRRLGQHTRDTYAGVPIAKFPEDLRVYEHLIWTARPNTVIEIGVKHGGSALWFRDRLVTLESYGLIEHPCVISIDLDIRKARRNIEASGGNRRDVIALLQGDVMDPSLPEAVRRLLPGNGPSCLVVEDSAHTYESTTAALEGFRDFVGPGGYFVVEDGIVDVEELPRPHGPRGVIRAIHDWLASPSGAQFRMRRDLELYGISCHPQGFLQRTA